MTHPLVEKFIHRCENRPEQIDNGSLYAGSPMYFYCKFCGHLSDVLPESYYLTVPTHVCDDCDILKEADLLADALAEKENMAIPVTLTVLKEKKIEKEIK